MALMTGMLPPGFRFHPTDEELVAFYLRRKVSGTRVEFDVIAEIELYRHEPWELPALSCLQSQDQEWYFFNPADRKYPRGSRTNRATAAGYWKATGKDRKVFCASKLVGFKKTLVFYQGRAPSGVRTDWVMHEFQLARPEEELCPNPNPNLNPNPNPSTNLNPGRDSLVLCRVLKKNGLGPSFRNQLPTFFLPDDNNNSNNNNNNNNNQARFGYGCRIDYSDGNASVVENGEPGNGEFKDKYMPESEASEEKVSEIDTQIGIGSVSYPNTEDEDEGGEEEEEEEIIDAKDEVAYTQHPHTNRLQTLSLFAEKVEEEANNNNNNDNNNNNNNNDNNNDDNNNNNKRKRKKGELQERCKLEVVL